jgi:putative ABC transport system permease protein
LAQDLRYALRSLARSPGFAGAAVLTLALAVGANTAVFSVVDAILLDPLPFPDQQRLVTVWEDLSARGGPTQEWTGTAVFDAWRDGARSFAGLTAVTGWSAAMAGGERPEIVPGAAVTHEYFRVLGVEPVLGRGFAAAEETPGTDRVLVLSHGLWRRRFGGDPAVVGTAVEVNGAPYAVVGVAPEGLRGPIVPQAEAWTVLSVAPVPQDWGNYYLRVVGRLGPGVERAAAAAELDGVMARLGRLQPADLGGAAVTVESLHETVAGPVRAQLLALLGAVGLVLLVACVNVANLTLARAFGRDRELAMRAALGAPRRRLTRQLVTEGLLLAFLGGLLGLALGLWATELLRTFAPPGTPRLDEVRFDGSVFAFTLAVTAATGVLFGLVPALAAFPSAPRAALDEGGRAGSSARRVRLRAGLVMAELALGLALLVAAGLLLRTLDALQREDPGFRADGVVAGQLLFPSGRYPEPERVPPFVARLLERLEAVPDVVAAGAVSVLPLSGGQTDASYVVEGRLPPAGEEPAADFRIATPRYFETLGIPLLRGRQLADRDDAAAPLVVVVSEELARRAFPGDNPVGRRLRVGATRDPETPWRTVVGVVGGVRDNALAKPPDPEIYMPLAQQPTRGLQVVIRGAAGSDGLPEILRRTVATLDPAQPIGGLGPLAEQVRSTLGPERFLSGLLAAFAAVALLLAAVGLYGVMAYSVGQRTREIGIRMAVGARPRDAMGLVLRQGALLIAGGLVIGAALAWGLSRLLTGLLYGVAPGDPATLAATAALLVATSLVAAYLPARRAARVDPVAALRGG